MKDYRSKSEKLTSWFLESRNSWKERALQKQKKLRAAQIKIRDLETSREYWKKRAKQAELNQKETEQESKVQLKKGGYSGKKPPINIIIL